MFVSADTAFAVSAFVVSSDSELPPQAESMEIVRARDNVIVNSFFITYYSLK
jgi:hypothetical protein